MSIDRTFIDKFDSYIFTIRRILYFGDTNKNIQPSDPKHDRWRFINVFGAETNKEYYNSKKDVFEFGDDSRLKDEFANIYSCKSLTVSQMGDLCQIFAELDHNGKTADEITCTSTRMLKNISRRLANEEELIQSGSVIAKGNHKKIYTKNIDLMDEFNNKQKFIEALDFAIKKNNFSAFVSLYKKLVSFRDGIEDIGCNIEIDHQLFHPILDEKHIWEAITAITEQKKLI